MFVHLRCASLLLLFCAVSGFAGDQPQHQDLPSVPMKATSVAVFKNNLSFFVKQGSARISNGEGLILDVPDAAMGSLRVAPSDPGSSLEELVVYESSVKTDSPASSVADMLRANVGSTATVRFGDQAFTGKIIAADSSNLLLLKTEDKMLGMRLDAVTWASIANPKLTLQSASDKSTYRFRLKGAAEETHLEMSYLQQGLGWTPSYLIQLKDDKTAQMTMQAVLTNNVEDLRAVDVFFVVGAPNFLFARSHSPMAADADNSLRGSESNSLANIASNGMPPRSMEGFDESVREESGTGAGLSGAAEQDLFLYSLPKISLSKGERGLYNLFAADVAYEHLYEWTVTENDSIDVYGDKQSRSDPNAKDVVWHSLILKNSTNYPWTSAPAMVLSGDKPVSQDILRYAPKGAPGVVRLSVAPDVRSSQKEMEVERKSSAAKFFDHDYDVVTIEGTLKMTNYKKEPIKLRVTKRLIGTVLTAEENPKTEKVAEELRAVNPRTTMTWEITLMPGVKKNITYRYQVNVD